MARRYFTTEGETETKLVPVRAVKRGTVTGRAGIFHFDPKGKDPRARSRPVPAEVAEEARRRGLVEVGGTSTEEQEQFESGGDVSLGGTGASRISTVVASRRATSIQDDGEETRAAEFFGTSGADTRDTTAFASDPSKTARVSTARVITVGDAPADDDDADDDDGDDVITGSTGFDDATLMEGDAKGSDAPPIDDVALHAGSDQGVGADATDDTGTANDRTDDETKVAAAEATEAPAAAPRPRRGRGTASSQ